MAKIKKAQKGAEFTKVTDSIKPAKPKYNGYRPPYVPSGKNQSKFDEGIESVKKLYQDGKLKQQRTGGAVKKAQSGASMEDPLERKLPKRKVLPSMTRIEKEKDTTANSTRRQLLDGFQKGPSPSKRKYKNGGAAPKAQFGKMIKSGLGKLSSEAKAIKSGIKEGMTQGVQSYRKNKFFNEMDRLKGTGKVAKMPKGMGFKSGGKVSKMKNGGSLSALNASNKRDRGIDPTGAFTTVQKKALAGAKGKASLTKDKQLGATRMAKRGMSIKKK